MHLPGLCKRSDSPFPVLEVAADTDASRAAVCLHNIFHSDCLGLNRGFLWLSAILSWRRTPLLSQTRDVLVEPHVGHLDCVSGVSGPALVDVADDASDPVSHRPPS